jgi:hypothetical protein
MAPLLECHEASKHHLLKFGFFLLDSINLGFLLRERLATVLIILSSWGSQLGGYSARIKLFFWRRCRGKKRLLQGEFRMHILYFVFFWKGKTVGESPTAIFYRLGEFTKCTNLQFKKSKSCKKEKVYVIVCSQSTNWSWNFLFILKASILSSFT